MKTARYYLMVEGYEYTMIDMEITKSNFESQMKKLDKVVEETKEYEIPTELNYYEYKNETYVKKVWHYKSGCFETLLIKYECNEGYYFKNKKRKREC